ncbi:PepSY domain-containing protein [bacterium]|nr:MAG: PepSY domain-containing protein [bacterium]
MSTAGFVKKSSKALHKWIGLFGFFWLAVMGATGIILNHPGLISSIDLPRSFLPGNYEYRDWNRNAFRGAVESPEGGLLLYGETGIWRFYGDFAPPSDFSSGLPTAAYLRDVRDLMNVDGTLLAATRGGLYARGALEPSWKPVALSSDYPVDLFFGRDRIFALTRSDLYAAPLYDPLSFSRVTPGKAGLKDPKRSLFRLVFDMHYGETWGSAGRYLMDLAGVYLVFGSLTGAWFWWRKKRKTLAKGRGGKLAGKGLRLHIKLGLWFAPLLVFSALTGVFERPPFLVAIADAEYPMSLHPGPRHENPWHDTLRKGLYDPSRESVVLATSEGFYEGKEFLLGKESASFHKLPGGAPVSVMGATVFEKDLQSPGSSYLVGSMSGLYHWDRDRKEVVNLFTGEPPKAPKGPPVGDQMVVGYAPLDLSGRYLWADYNKGLFLSDGRTAGISLPPELEDGGRISLWHALFELHNGRFFTFLLGWWSWLVVPLTGLCLIVETLTGVYDRLRAKR